MASVSHTTASVKDIYTLTFDDLKKPVIKIAAFSSSFYGRFTCREFYPKEAFGSLLNPSIGKKWSKYLPDDERGIDDRLCVVRETIERYSSFFYCYMRELTMDLYKGKRKKNHKLKDPDSFSIFLESIFANRRGMPFQILNPERIKKYLLSLNVFLLNKALEMALKEGLLAIITIVFEEDDLRGKIMATNIKNVFVWAIKDFASFENNICTIEKILKYRSAALEPILLSDALAIASGYECFSNISQLLMAMDG